MVASVDDAGNVVQKVSGNVIPTGPNEEVTLRAMSPGDRQVDDPLTDPNDRFAALQAKNEANQKKAKTK